MLPDAFYDELEAVALQMQAAQAALDDVYRRYGIEDGDILVIDSDDVDAMRVVAEMRSANQRQQSFLNRFPDV